MYAVIATGGKQEKVSTGDRVSVERLGLSQGDSITFTPLLLVDDASVVTDAAALARATVTATVVDEVKGPKVRGFTYKNKSNNRRRWGHRQSYQVIEVTGISASGGKG